MDIIYNYEWEILKTFTNLWNKYEKPIQMEDRDLAVWKIDDICVLPKFFVQNNMIELAGIQEGVNIINRVVKEEHIGASLNLMTTTIQARKEQIPIFEEIQRRVDNKESVNGLIIAQPGFGKSIVAIKTVELLNTKSLIIVPNDILEEQFVESIVEFTNLTKEDIGIAQGSDIIALQRKGVFDKDIVVGKIQSLYAQLKACNLMELYELYSIFGLVIYDEAHVGNASDGYAKTGILFKTDNIMSMTATPYRNGINEFLFRNSTGGILYQSDHQNLIPQVNLHNGIIEFTEKEVQRLMFSRTDYIRFMATYNMILETKDAYFEWIANWVEYRNSQGHNTAILFATNKMVHKLGLVLKRRKIDVGILTGQTEKKLEEPIQYLSKAQLAAFNNEYYEFFPKRKSIPAPKVFKDDKDKFKLTKPILKDIEKMIVKFPSLEPNWTKPDNMTEREIMKSKNNIVSNFKLLSAGFDKSELSCIIFGSLIIGKVPVIQSLGRICRLHPDKINDIHAHFMFTQQFMNFFPDMLHILTNNIKTQYPSKFTYEGFDFGKK
ncbi:MAG: hypothetical protein DRG78_09335 [Epsilonproteobacteria bacterium]|nr:MAG: hypothetical protein DRG78_09335 [Campylobacterota bacterium]